MEPLTHYPIRRWVIAVGFVACLFTSPVARADGKFSTSIAPDDVDRTTFAQWVAGVESPIVNKDGPSQIIWTTKTGPSHAMLPFGDGKKPGLRHLRLGFGHAVPIGSVLVRGGGSLSVLKPDAAYPGDLSNDAQWLTGSRLVGGSAGAAEAGRDDLAIWVLPLGTSTRAIRFSHAADVVDPAYAGVIAGVMVLKDRLVNLAPGAHATAGANPQKAIKLNNERIDRDPDMWDNDDSGPSVPVSQRPVTIGLSWPQEVTIHGLAALNAGFGSAHVEALKDSWTAPPAEAPDDQWQLITTWRGVENQYPRQLAVNWLDLGGPVSTRAIRLQIDQPTKEQHPHLNGRTHAGARVWLGELMALHDIAGAELGSIKMQKPSEPPAHPPIAIRFSLEHAGLVTLVIDDPAGNRVRNLISETPFPAGANVAWWDGLDDLGRDPEAARHGIYSTPGTPVKPGRYSVRGLVHDPFNLRYEFSVYTAGHPAWNTDDKTGAWLANHTPPMATLFVPAKRSPVDQSIVYLGSYVSEGTHGLAWVDLDGKKLGGENWVGGNWTGAPYLAFDDGPNAIAEHSAYAGSVWNTGKGSSDAELRLTALTRAGDVAAYKETWPLAKTKQFQDDQLSGEIGGMAVRNGVAAFSLRRQQTIALIDIRSKKRMASIPVLDPRGIAFDQQGRLLVLSGQHLIRLSLDGFAAASQDAIISAGLEDPIAVTIDGAGRLYLSDWGQSHQVKIFSAKGESLGVIGKPGAPRAGLYDALHINHPYGLSIDDRNRLWVAERDDQPKRVSVWSLDGKLLNAMYGPSAYGGGGAIDSGDRGLFHYNGMTFGLDWDKGRDALMSVPYRHDAATMQLGFRNAPPETAIHVEGRTYLTNCYNSNPTGGTRTAFVFLERDHVAVPVAGAGRADDWAILKEPRFRANWPKGIDPAKPPYKNEAWFIWTDANGDGLPQPEEVSMRVGACGGVTVMPDLSLVLARVEDQTFRLPVARYSAGNAPSYDLDHPQVLATGVKPPKSSGGDQALVDANGWAVVTLGIGDYSPFSLCGAYKGQARWSYPSVWPGLHASHEAAVPDRPGEVVGSTRLLGGFISTPVGPMWCVNGNMGPMYLFTADGLFVQTLFQDIRLGKPWSMPTAERGMLLNDESPHDENFFPSIGQTSDGRVFIQDGGRSTLVRVDGLNTVRRLPDQAIDITAEQILTAQNWTLAAEASRQKQTGHESLKVVIRKRPPTLDGNLDDWSGAQWATIDKRGIRAWFNSNSKPYDVAAAACIAGDRLYLVYRTNDPDLPNNSGDTANAAFKTGGGLDLMLATDPGASPSRSDAAPGDVRLIVTRVKGKYQATLYRPVVPGTPAAQRVPFSSPWRTIYFDRVDDVSDQLQAAGRDGVFECSVPLATLGLKTKPGTTIQADLGVLRGAAMQTIQRAYWSNKATAITSDVPSEAMLTPSLWGRWILEDEK